MLTGARVARPTAHTHPDRRPIGPSPTSAAGLLPPLAACPFPRQRARLLHWRLALQTLNGLDMVVSPLMSAGIFRTYSTAIRLANNVVGGLSFATIARVTGVQKSSAPPAEAPAELAKKK